MPDRAETVGDIALVLHSHMPYVEGFGTYPFGEEWLFDAVIRSYLPVLDVARDLTLTVTPVLADQLEDGAVATRLREFLLRHRIEAAEADIADLDDDCRPAAEAEAVRYREALDRLDSHGSDLLASFRQTAAEQNVAFAASSATHAVLPMLATEGMRAVQVESGIASHRRRFGWGGGFWLPECAYEPGLEHLLASAGVEWFCVDQSATPDPPDPLRPIPLPETGQLAFPIDWEAIRWLWSWEGYPADPAYAQFAGKSLRGARIWKIGGGAYYPDAAREAAKRHAHEFTDAIAQRLIAHRERTGERGLITYAFDTELLGHWWSEGPLWLAEVLELLPSVGVRAVTLDTAFAERAASTERAAADGSPGISRPAAASRAADDAPSTSGERSASRPPASTERAAITDRSQQSAAPPGHPIHRSTWGEGKDLRTWDSPEVSDMAWAARRLELRLLQAIGRGLHGTAAERAVRELLAVQSSDWAFLDGRRQAGDYAFERATEHARAALEAIESADPVDPHMRALAPDLTLAPMHLP